VKILKFFQRKNVFFNSQAFKPKLKHTHIPKIPQEVPIDLSICPETGVNDDDITIKYCEKKVRSP
jgi:hypothetical protein